MEHRQLLEVLVLPYLQELYKSQSHFRQLHVSVVLQHQRELITACRPQQIANPGKVWSDLKIAIYDRHWLVVVQCKVPVQV